MKKTYLLLLFACLSVITQAQIAIPNGNFEQWTTATYEDPQFYSFTSNFSSFQRNNSPFNCVKTTDFYNGSYALKLTTEAGKEPSVAYIINGEANDNNPCNWRGGVPYNQKPTGINGYYKSNVVTGDSAGIIVVFKSAGVCLGTYMYSFKGVQSTYTPFSFTFSPALAVTPDTVIFAAVSSFNWNNNAYIGSMLQLDYIAFTGAVSQPTQFNGNFETWQSTTIKSPDNWYLNTGDQDAYTPSQTTDAYKGVYAIELKSFLGDNNGNPVNRGGSASTGYYVCPNGGGNNCFEVGGYPFTNIVDTLAFYYKYTPSGNDSANVSITFRKNGIQINGNGKNLHAASVYTYVEIPFNTGTIPDTVVVGFQSSNWNDTLLSFIGSTLKIDEVHLKSQPLSTGIKNYEKNNSISIYPNPSMDGIFQISNVGSKDVINVYNILGERMNAFIERGKENVLIRLPSDTNGIYFIQVNSDGKVFTQKIIVGG